MTSNAIAVLDKIKDLQIFEDENVFALRLAGLFADEYILKFVLDDVKIEFFVANRPN